MYEYRALVHKIVDGDTVDLDVDLGFGVWKLKERFRLSGINAPEKATDAGKRSKAYLEGVLKPGAEVTVRTYKDSREKYGRYLADVLVVGSNYGSINQLLVQMEMAVAWDGKGPRP